MRSLVFGGTGRLGGAVAERLRARGDEVHAYGRRIERLPEAVNYAIFCQRYRGPVVGGEYGAAVTFTARVLDMLGWADDGDTAIVVVASVCVGLNDVGAIDYQCGKAAAVQLVRHYSNRYRCNSVSPWSFTGDKPELAMAEVVNVIEFLSSDKSTGINGQNIIIDHGKQHRWN